MAQAKKSAKKSRFDIEPFIKSLDPDAAQTQPTLPVSVAKLEAQRLYQAASKERATFKALPDFDLNNLDAIPDLIRALDAAQNGWVKARLERQGNSLKGTRTDAEKLRASMMAAARYLLRKDAKAQAILDDISHGEGLADLIDDLKRLASILDANAKLFRKAPKLPKDASSQANRLALVLGNGVDSGDANAAQARRNQVFAVLEQALSEVREAAKYLFHDEPKKLAPMLSHYEGQRKRALRKKGQPAPAPGQSMVSSGQPTT